MSRRARSGSEPRRTTKPLAVTPEVVRAVLVGLHERGIHVEEMRFDPAEVREFVLACRLRDSFPGLLPLEPGRKIAGALHRGKPARPRTPRRVHRRRQRALARARNLPRALRFQRLRTGPVLILRVSTAIEFEATPPRCRSRPDSPPRWLSTAPSSTSRGCGHPFRQRSRTGPPARRPRLHRAALPS